MTTEQTAAAVISTTAGDVALVRVGADITADVADELREVLADATTRGRHVVLDLTSVHTLHPQGLALLVRVRQQLRQEDDGQLCLSSPSRFVLTVLHTMKLERAFPVFPDTTEAIAWLNAGALHGPPPALLADRPA